MCTRLAVTKRELARRLQVKYDIDIRREKVKEEKISRKRYKTNVNAAGGEQGRRGVTGPVLRRFAGVGLMKEDFTKRHYHLAAVGDRESPLLSALISFK